MSDIINLTSESFDNAISQTDTIPALVDFWAPWCGPCKAIGPILEELATELDGKVQIYKVDVDNNPQIAERYSIRAIPTILIFKKGELVEQVVGMASKEDLKSKVAQVS